MIGIQRWVLFPRFAVLAMPNAGAGVRDLHRMWLSTSEGDVEAWFLPAPGASAEAPAPVALFAHGNGELIEHWPQMLEPYRRMGVSLFLPEYRGYGRSAGNPSESAITEDFERFYDRLVARPEVDASRIVFHGRSLGGGAVCQLAARRKPAALVLQSTFTSVADVARRWLVPRRLVLDPFDSLPIVERLGVPTLVVHGERDTLIPVSQARALHRAAPGSRLVLYEADHNDCPPEWDPFWQEVRSFLQEAGIVLSDRT